ncbi:MAG: trypsin-like peptidase domain-containing protein [Bacteroidota bacterium]
MRSHLLARWGLAALLAAASPLATASEAERAREAAPAATESVSPEAVIFSSLDRRAVEVGGLVEFSVEVLAPMSAAATGDRWEAALGAALLTESADVTLVRAWPVARRDGDGVVELQRRFVLRVLREGALRIPAMTVGPLATRPQTLRGFAAWPEGTESVVPIVAQGRSGQSTFRRTGTAWLAAPDALVTAYHVVVGASKVRVALPSGRTASVRRVWSLDPERDIAVLHIEPDETEGMRALVIAPEARATDAQSPEASREAVAFTAGWPLGTVPEPDGFGRRQLRTAAALYTPIGPDGRRLRVSSNAVRPGDSGGPLLDAQGRVLGVVVSGRSTSGEADLLREDLCLAADPLPALRQRRSEPEPLARALRESARAEPTAQAYEAATALVGPVVRSVDAPQQRARLADALRQAPNDAALQFLAGSVFEALGDDVAAARAYRGAREAGYFPATYALAHHYLEIDPVRAERLFAEVRQAAPYAHLGAMGHARTLVSLGRWAEAEEAALDVLDHDARFAPALYLLGVVRLAQGREGEARALARRLEVRPAWAKSLNILLRHEALRPTALRPLARATLGPLPGLTE